MGGETGGRSGFCSVDVSTCFFPSGRVALYAVLMLFLPGISCFFIGILWNSAGGGFPNIPSRYPQRPLQILPMPIFFCVYLRQGWFPNFDYHCNNFFVVAVVVVVVVVVFVVVYLFVLDLFYIYVYI